MLQALFLVAGSAEVGATRALSAARDRFATAVVAAERVVVTAKALAVAEARLLHARAVNASAHGELMCWPSNAIEGGGRKSAAQHQEEQQ